MLVSSYHGGTASSGIINIIMIIDQDTGRDIICRRYIDTGKNLKSLKELFEERNVPRRHTLLTNSGRTFVEIEADYTCFTIPSQSLLSDIVLNYDEVSRDLPLCWCIKRGSVLTNRGD